MYLGSHISSKNKYKRFRCAKQGWNIQLATPSYNVVQDPTQFFKNLRQSQVKVLNYLLTWSNAFRDMYFSQDTMARALGLSRKTVNEALGELEGHGLIVSNYRSLQRDVKFKYRSNQYKVSTWFNNLDLRDSLKGILHAFWWFPIALLNPHQINNVTQLDNNIYIYNQSTVCKRVGIPSGIHPTRVEIMESWKPVGSITVTKQKIVQNSELFRDPRINKPEKSWETDTTGSKKSNLALRKELGTAEHLRKLRDKVSAGQQECMRLAYSTQEQIDDYTKRAMQASPDFGEFTVKAFMNKIEQGRKLLAEHGITDFLVKV